MIRSFFALAVPLMVMAIDSVTPVTLCDRFITSSEQQSCQSELKN